MRNETKSREVFPVGLMIEGRPCLVVGSGNIAAHKTHLLLDAKAKVTVVGPQPGKEISALAGAKSIKYLQREFKESDIDGKFLVFAATSDETTNRRVIECCRKSGTLCCTVDSSWTSSDFVTPAIIRKAGLTLSISSGGQSCRKTKLVKTNIARHMEMIASADLIVMGTSCQQIPIKRLKQLHMTRRQIDQTGRMLLQISGIHEFMLLNTGDRIELIGVVSEDKRIVDLLKRIMPFFHLKDHEYYVKRGFKAFEHVSMVRAGLLTQPEGNTHIIDQLKESLEYSTVQKWSGSMLLEWIDAAILVSREIRQAAEPLRKHQDMTKIPNLCRKVVEKNRNLYKEIIRSFQRNNRAK